MRLLPLFVFWCLWFLNFSARTVFSPILPLIEDTLSLSHGEATGLFTSLSIGYSLTLLVSGRTVQAWGHRRMVVTGFLGIALVLFAFQWARSYVALHVLFFFLGAASGAYIPSILPIITGTYDQRHWGKAIGFHDSAASLSIFSVPILIAVGLQFISWRTILLILGVACLVLPVLFWKVSEDPKDEASGQSGSYASLFGRRTIWIMSLLWVFSAASCMGLYSVLPLYLIKERGIDFNLANTLFGISRAGGVVVSILAGYLGDRFGYRRILTVSVLTTGLSTIGLSLASTQSWILLTLLLQATFSLAFFPVGLATILKSTPLSDRSMAVGMIAAIGVILGTGVTPFLLGVIADHLNFRTGIMALGVLTALSSLATGLMKETQK